MGGNNKRPSSDARFRDTMEGDDIPESNTGKMARKRELNQKSCITDLFVIGADEDIQENVLEYLQDQGRFPLHLQGHSCLCAIVTATGSIHCPVLACARMAVPTVPYEGPCDIHDLIGHFSVRRDGKASPIGNMRISFGQAGGPLVGGSVIGPLISATPVLVTVTIFIHAPGEEEL